MASRHRDPDCCDRFIACVGANRPAIHDNAAADDYALVSTLNWATGSTRRPAIHFLPITVIDRVVPRSHPAKSRVH